MSKNAIYFVMLFVVFLSSFAKAQNKLVPQPAIFDPPTAHTLSIVVPTLLGDLNRNGTIEVFYREKGKNDWKNSIGLYRNNNGKESNQPFAGMLFELNENTEYEIKLVAKDPDGVEGEAEQVVTGRTTKIPLKITIKDSVEVSNFEELTKAINDAQAGAVILLNKGAYVGKVSINNKKNSIDKPILIRGKDLSECIIQGSITISDSSFIHIENLTILGGSTGIYLSKCESIVIRDNLILKVDNGITAKGGHQNLYIANNTIIGNNLFGDITNATWNDEGIVITGMGHELAYNTLAGFGDSIGMSHSTSLRNRAIDMHHNLVLWGGDDGVEMDFSDRNTQAHHNVFSNAANGISCQMVWNGPAYVYKNVMYNIHTGPYKIKPERAPNDGLFIMNNTSIKSGMAYINYSTAVDGLFFVNNLFVGTKTNEVMMMGAHGAGISNLSMDYNAWSYDGSFSIAKYGSAKNFEEWKTKHSQGNNDISLEGQKIFDELVLDFDKNDFKTWRNPFQDYSLDKNSKAINAGLVVPGINDKFIGSAPDIGAWEFGEKKPVFGAFRDDQTPPNVPEKVKGTAISTKQIDLTWEPAKDVESGIIFYSIYRNGLRIANIIGALTFSDINLEEATEYSYDVVAVNGRALESKRTNSLKIKTLEDTIVPKVSYINSYGNNTEIYIAFNKAIAKETAENVNNYKIENEIVISKATLQSNNNSVVLTTSALQKDSNYHLTISNIKDNSRKQNQIAMNTKVSFQYKELKTFVDFATKKLEVKGFDKFIRDKSTDFIKGDVGGIGPVAKLNMKDSNYQGIVSDTPRDFRKDEAVYVTWYNNSNEPISFTPKISFTHKLQPNNGIWFEMSSITLQAKQVGVTIFKFDEKTAGSYSLVNVSCNVQVVGSTLICNKIQFDSK